MTDTKTILIVDDVEDLRESLADSFEIRGFKIVQAENGVDALELMKSETVDVVLSDIRMPEMDGVELLKAIKQKDPRKPPVLIMSGFSDYDREQVTSLGALDLVEKPFDFDQITEIINEALKDINN
ncbi:MAG: response regulator [Bdellovibrionaceae bacterium]|nr:response regulator [Pseudobdellovibrionaceae bacterium]